MDTPEHLGRVASPSVLGEVVQHGREHLSRPAPAVAGRLVAGGAGALRAVLPRAAGVGIGQVVEVAAPGPRPLWARVHGFSGAEVLLTPLGSLDGVAPGASVWPMGRGVELACGPGLLGRVVDALGEPLDGRGPVCDAASHWWPVERPAPLASSRKAVSQPLVLGIRAIDGLASLGRGQRVGLFAGPGLGKSALMLEMMRHAEADVVVVGLIGERGREVAELLEALGQGQAQGRTLVVSATSDRPPGERLLAAQVATTAAEWFRAQGKAVLLVLDSLTRVAHAHRELALSAGEPPGRQGLPASLPGVLARLVERVGNDHAGSITAIYTVLVSGDGQDDVVAEEVRSLLDGHIVLSAHLAASQHWPAIDVLSSVSRVMWRVADEAQLRAATRFRKALALVESRRAMRELGAYQPGKDPSLDAALACEAAMLAFLRQGLGEHTPWGETCARLERAVPAPGGGP